MITLRRTNAPSDKEFLFNTRSNPSVCQMLLGSPPKSMQDHLNYVEHLPPCKHIFIIWAQDTRVGYCQLNTETGEIGIVIHPEFQGRGYGKEGAQALIRLSSIRFEMKFLCLDVMNSNDKALAIYQKLGFKKIGELGPIIKMKADLDPMPGITVITPTYNKPKMLPDAIRSLQEQTFRDWVWWIVVNGPDAETEEIVRKLAAEDPHVVVYSEEVSDTQRKERYFPAACINKYYPMVTTKYVFWLSDDDILPANTLTDLVEALEKEPNWDVVYGEAEILFPSGDKFVADPKYKLTGDQRVFCGGGARPDGIIDGGQILQTKRSFDRLEKTGFKCPTDWTSGLHVDGIYMNALSGMFPFYPIKKHVLDHRVSQLATHRKP